MTHKDTVTLETNKRFSESCIWHAQREYYAQSGIDAWGGGEVPFYITSNPFIADCYARLLFSFIKDTIRQHPEAAEYPFYILELGAGSGQFGFYLVKRIAELLNEPAYAEVKVCYVMSDFAESNVAFWQSHDILMPYVQTGLLDFAIFDAEHDHSIELIIQKKSLTPHTLKNPLTVFANYLFDSIPTDLFYIKEKQIKESRVTLTTPQDNLNANLPIDWRAVKAQYEEITIDAPYYAEPRFNTLLAEYAESLTDTKLQFPIGSLRCLENLRNVSNQKLFLVTSDKGYGNLGELDELSYVDLDSHGSFSVMVNFHALMRYFQLSGGDAYLQTPHDSLVTGVFMHGLSLKNFPSLNFRLDESLEGFSPIDYFNVFDHLTKNISKCTLNQLVSYLSLSRWDPYLFNDVIDHLYQNISDGEVDTVAFLKKNLTKIENNFYFIPDCDDTFFNIGLILLELEDFETSIQYNEKSLAQFGEDYSTFFNMGLCYYHLDQFEQAETFFEKALEQKHNSKEAKQWLKKTKGKRASS